MECFMKFTLQKSNGMCEKDIVLSLIFADLRARKDGREGPPLQPSSLQDRQLRCPCESSYGLRSHAGLSSAGLTGRLTVTVLPSPAAK